MWLPRLLHRFAWPPRLPSAVGPKPPKNRGLSTIIARLLSRLREVSEQFDPQRLEQELLLLAQKSDVAEELDRLTLHLQETREVLLQGGAIGRRLDFIMQELNREANTLGAKSTAAPITRAVVEIKVLVEQMREQVQNLE